ncbi:hypothetical protein ALPO108162_01285 [Alicyclobacillus pomorum]|jgi:hypothetical protein|uniref:hypothetical protein n=1 Tax=Alicyclobacillus pomorum TaxID=204470 RepID=UPI0003F7798D|nr:hypothetical protein [Alicyclobacillus pomorum]
MTKDYHCCATCRHFEMSRVDGRPQPRCRRLGYETKTFYKFHCWDPRPDIAQKVAEANKTPNSPS